MSNSLYGSIGLCSLAEELAQVVQGYRTTLPEGTQLRMYNQRQEGLDEIYVISEEVGTGKKWVVVKLALAELSASERTQLNLQIELYNQSMIH